MLSIDGIKILGKFQVPHDCGLLKYDRTDDPRKGSLMPTSMDPEPAEDEIECARCGAHFYYGLTRCPNCGVNLYEPEDYAADFQSHQSRKNILATITDLIHKALNRPYSADDVFGNSLDPAGLYDDLLRRTGGNRETTD